MSTVAEAFEAGSPVPAYLAEVVRIHRDVLGPQLIALYLHGSVVQKDFLPGFSDLDLLGVVSGPIGASLCDQLVDRLSHENLPVPACGLELILCASRAVSAPIVEMPYEFALSTGQEWGAQVETDGVTSDILIHMQLCRQAGLALVGAPARDVLAPISMIALHAALMGEMLWHRNDLCVDPNDQSISNAVLNAARSLYARETGQIISKTEGGRWWLALNPEDRVVADALEFRERGAGSAPDVRSARNFVELAIVEL